MVLAILEYASILLLPGAGNTIHKKIKGEKLFIFALYRKCAVTWPTETKTNILVVIPEWSKDKQPPIEAPEICLSDKDPKIITAEQLHANSGIKSDCSTAFPDVGVQGNMILRPHSPQHQDSWFQTSNKVDRFAIVFMPILFSTTTAIYWTYFLCRYLQIFMFEVI